MKRARAMQYVILFFVPCYIYECMGFPARALLDSRVATSPEIFSSIDPTCLDVKESCIHEPPSSNNRRFFIKSLSFVSSYALVPSLCWAFELDGSEKTVGEAITEAVTKSDIGISVRRSVVQGAQFMDKLDKQWEQFSDNFHLGAQRSQTEDRPKPKIVPPRRPINSVLAQRILMLSDETFLALLSVSATDLATMIDKVDSVVQMSFIRAGLDRGSMKGNIGSAIISDMSGDLFNYFSYIRFKAYCQLLLDSNVQFQSFKYEDALGLKMAHIFYPDDSIQMIESPLNERLQKSFKVIDTVLESLINNGFIASSERNGPQPEQIEDWIDGIAPCSFTIALDGDSTLQGQILLQEQGFKLYPSFCKFLIRSVLRKIFQGSSQIVSIEEYYMDTNYNSDPDLFDAKQVLLNVVIEES